MTSRQQQRQGYPSDTRVGLLEQDADDLDAKIIRYRKETDEKILRFDKKLDKILYLLVGMVLAAAGAIFKWGWTRCSAGPPPGGLRRFFELVRRHSFQVLFYVRE